MCLRKRRFLISRILVKFITHLINSVSESTPPIPPITRLPPELLAAIFECFGEQWSAQHDVVASVCRSWKAELLQMPSVYQEIHIRCNGIDRDLSLCGLVNAIKCCIDLKMDEEYDQQRAVIDSVLAQTHRLVEVNISFGGSIAALERMMQKLKGASAPRLRKLHISASFSDRARLTENYQRPYTDAPFEGRILSGGCPHLIELSTSGIIASLWPPVETVQYANLRTERQFLTRDAFATVLNAMSSLKTLVLNADMMMFRGGATPKIALPALLALSIWDSWNQSYLWDFLDSTDMPMLERLRMIQCSCGPNPLLLSDSQFCSTTTRQYPLVKEVAMRRCEFQDEKLFMSEIHQVFPSAELVIAPW